MTAPSPRTPDALATEVSFRPFALGGATATFALIGATSSLYGPLLVSFSHRFHLSLPSAGAVLSMHFVGALFGVLLAWIGVKRYSGALVLSVALLLMAGGAVGAAYSHDWNVFLACVLLIGLGYGGLDFALNTLLTRTAARGRALRLSVTNAGFGVGAVIGPLLIVTLRPQNFPHLFAGIAVGAVILSTFNRGVHAPALRAEVRQREVSMMKSQRRPILLTFVVAYILYIAVETSASGWMATQLHASGYTQSFASVVTAGFWTGIALGRGSTGLFHRRLADRHLVLGGLGLAALLSGLALSHLVAPYAYPLLGLVLAAVFPMGLIWYTTLCPHDSDGLALMILFMMAGGVIGPGSESFLVSIFGTHVVPVAIGGFALLDLGVFASALRFKPLQLA